jgi:hypothetical protein
MTSKKIVTLFLKLLIGVGSFAVIFWRLKDEFSGEHAGLLSDVFTDLTNLMYIAFATILFPVNWLIESMKWRWVTHQVEHVSLLTAQKSVYAGVCVGNLAPGRATEFLAKIHFFKPQNKLAVTILHFINGMFQLSVTILLGILGLIIKTEALSGDGNTMKVLSVVLSVLVLVIFTLALFRINYIISWLYKRYSSSNYEELKPVKWSVFLLLKMFGFSFLRYAVFTIQFLLIASVFPTEVIWHQMLVSVWIYFLFTTIIPMFSVIEAAVRAAIAMIVFQGLGLTDGALAVIAILIWIINIVFPSVVGYIVLLRENLSLQSFKLRSSRLPND